MEEIKEEEMKKVQLDILIEVDRFCKENNIRYAIAYGTLIGAIRHHGFIPWDDDIDLLMLRKDYNRFIQTFNQNNDGPFRVLHQSLDAKFPYEFAKVEDCRYRLIENLATTYEMGIAIDIFVLDDIGDDPKNVQRVINKNRYYKHALCVKGMNEKDRPLIERIGIKCLKSLYLNLSVEDCVYNLNKNALAYTTSEDSEYVANLAQRWNKPSHYFPKAWFEDMVEVEFEGLKFPAPRRYHDILTIKYGDYMQLPPVKEQVAKHDFIAYKI